MVKVATGSLSENFSHLISKLVILPIQKILHVWLGENRIISEDYQEEAKVAD